MKRNVQQAPKARRGDSWRSGSPHRPRIALLASLGLVLASPCFPAADWESSVTPGPGTFPPPEPFVATYQFGWSGIAAATAEVTTSRPTPNRLQITGQGRSTGMARSLWPMDASYEATVDRDSLRPLEVKQSERQRKKSLTTTVVFRNSGVQSTRLQTKDGIEKTKVKTFDFPAANDLFSAILFVRSQPLADGSVQRFVVYPANSAYLATATVVAHEKLTVGAGPFPAIKMELEIKKIGKKGRLQSHKKFKRATVWLSDDSSRMLLRIEAQLFVGTVFADLKSFQPQ